MHLVSCIFALEKNGSLTPIIPGRRRYGLLCLIECHLEIKAPRRFADTNCLLFLAQVITSSCLSKILSLFELVGEKYRICKIYAQKLFPLTTGAIQTLFI